MAPPRGGGDSDGCVLSGDTSVAMTLAAASKQDWSGDEDAVEIERLCLRANKVIEMKRAQRSESSGSVCVSCWNECVRSDPRGTRAFRSADLESIGKLRDGKGWGGLGWIPWSVDSFFFFFSCAFALFG